MPWRGSSARSPRGSVFSVLVKVWVWSASPSKDPRVLFPAWGFCSRSLYVLAGSFLSVLVLVLALQVDASAFSLCLLPLPGCSLCSLDVHSTAALSTEHIWLFLKKKKVEVTHKLGCFCRVILKFRAWLVALRDAQGGDTLHLHLSRAPTRELAPGERLQTTHGSETVSSDGCVGTVSGLAAVFQLQWHYHNICSS